MMLMNPISFPPLKPKLKRESRERGRNVKPTRQMLKRTKKEMPRKQRLRPAGRLGD
jgi:hypothetical protein